ncbi:MAG: 30S ribosomal protein S12 methylthiotransferase RimO [Spirochaetia bacterium]|nr:30S ribosomal protein S12 methylthiotransferase RimO [Spirochaetota bacterium]MDW8111925.1 30S ribosomal protein S12 methylthiotransferase RimO [Spirochaetia bacterium]
MLDLNNSKIVSKKVFIETLGCAKNVVDSERVAYVLKTKGANITESPEEADIIMVNTCGFIEDAKQESIDYILTYARMKEELNKKRQVPQKLVVFGCLAERYKEELIKEIPEIDFISGVKDYLVLLDTLNGKHNGKILDTTKEYNDIIFSDRNFERVVNSEFPYAYLKISEGCNHTCSFCAIPLIRGKQRSRTIQSIVDEAKFLVDNGIKEVILVSQDTSNYGIDIYSKPRLVELLERLNQVDGLEWIRLHYLYPTEVSDELIDAVAGLSKVCKYFDIPLQHVSDRILKLMRRGGNKERYVELISRIREKVKDVAIRTTFIVGFPSETKEEFEELKEFVGNIRFNWMGVFTYSHEEGTYAFSMNDNIPKSTKSRRRNTLLRIQQKITEEELRKLVGKVKKVMIDTVLDDRNYIARSEINSPEIDGAIHLVSTRKLSKGDVVDAFVVKVVGYDLYARTI